MNGKMGKGSGTMDVITRRLKFAQTVFVWLLIVAASFLAATVCPAGAVTAPTVAVTGNLSTLFGTAAANQRVVYQYGLIQSIGGSVVPGGSACSVYTDSNGNLPTTGNCASFVQGACAFVTIGSGHPIEIQFPLSSTTDLSTLILANLDPPEVVSEILLSGPYAAGVVVTNPSLGQIGASTITWPTCNNVTISAATASIDTSTGLCQVAAMNATSTLTPVNLVNGQEETIYTIQDATGNRVPTWTAPAGDTLVWVGFGSTQPGFPTLQPNTVLKWDFTLNGSTIYGRLAGQIQPPALTVATLPAAAVGNEGQVSFVTDSTNACIAGLPLLGGGSNECEVFSDGDNWNILGTTSSTTGQTTVNFNDYSLTNVGNLQLIQQSAPGSLAVAATCTGTCATTYTYQVTCLTDTGETTGYNATGTNAASLSSSNFNVLTWAAQPACTGGYNVYGRTSGSLGLLANIAVGTTTYKDIGAAVAPDSYTFTFDRAAQPVVGVWDFSGELPSSGGQSPIDVHNNNSGTGTTAKATGLTTAINNETNLAAFGFGGDAGTLTAPSLSNTLNVMGVPGVNYGFTGGDQNVASAGAVAAITSTGTNSKAWGAVNMAITPATSATPLTFVSKASTTASAPYTSITFGNPASTVAGNINIACIAYLRTANITGSPKDSC